MSSSSDAQAFATILRRSKLSECSVRFGNFALPAQKGVTDNVNWNRVNDLLEGAHRYTLLTSGGPIQLSLELYENTLNHYRLFGYTLAGQKRGMAFSVNLTTKKVEKQGVIVLEQAVSFKERSSTAEGDASERRRRKQVVVCDILRRLGLEVDDEARVFLGIFDVRKRALSNTAPSDFLNSFIAITLLKGHFQGNKGYELDLLPSARDAYDMFAPATPNAKWRFLKSLRQVARPPIPALLRFKVFTRDGSVCRTCGRIAGGGVILHVDHIRPVSRGGDNSLRNLQTLCSVCNLGKGNRFIGKSPA